MILLLACTEPAVTPPVPDDTSDTSPPFLSPADALDLDPEADVFHVKLTAGLDGDGYAYDGQVPGPTMRAKVGDAVQVDFTNALDAPTTVHWHGMAVPNEMDGVAWLADPVQPGESFTYTFVADRAGTFWYHPHVDVDHQVEHGLYGVFVVEEDDAPADDLVIVWHGMLPDDHDDDDHDDDDHEDGGHDHTAGDPAAIAWTANGMALPDAAIPAGTRVRMLNASNTAYLDLAWPGMRQIGSDQGLLSALAEPTSVLLAPGDRADFEWAGDATIATARYTASGGAALGPSIPLMNVTEAPGTAPAWAFPGGQPSADPAYADLVYVFSGGTDGTWLINGEAYPDVTVSTLPLGADAILEIRNLSSSEHPFHVHGHRFEVLSVDGVPPAAPTVEDTVNVGIGQRVRLRLSATNPGDWMLHCHLLGHEEGGMMTVLRVE